MGGASRILLGAAAALGASGVVLGAWAAHGLAGALAPRQLATFQTAVLYHLLHAPAVAVCALLPGSRGATAGLLMVAGVLVFSGSLYLIAGLGLARLGPLTPLGGLALVAGWLALGWAAWRG